MLFNSFQYIVFFICTVVLYYALPHRFRWILILAASVAFYMAWRPVLIVLILFSCIVNFVASKTLVHPAFDMRRKWVLAVCLFINFALLFVFKYLTLFLNTLAFFNIGTPEFDIVLPMGISFFTFQAAGYTIDVFKRKISPERNFFKFVLFIMFFPQLVAGPIERAESLLPQLFSKKRFKLKNIAYGGRLMLFGFFKKVVIADRLSVLVSAVYASPRYYDGLALIIATVFFAFQIYCDFSGYSDIATGSAKCLGIDLMQNFRQPYLSKSVKEFWRRWHISLSGWFKDYVYIPLGGSRVSQSRFYFNTLVTFVISGMWHGANWTFLIWGTLHGAFQIIGDMFSQLTEKFFRFERRGGFHIWDAVCAVITFCAVCFAWIFFRAKTIGDAFYIVTHLFVNIGSIFNTGYVFNTLNGLGLPLLEVIICAALVIFLWVADCVAGDSHFVDAIEHKPSYIKFAFYLIIIAALMGLGVFYNAGQFIYFQF